MTFPLLATSAVVPSLLLVWFFHARDVFREPPRVLWTTFGLGVLIAAPVLLVAWPVLRFAQSFDNPLIYGFLSAFFAAAVPEELFKLLVLARYSMRHAEFDEPMDGIVYGATASLGFATLENVLYVADGGGAAAMMRAFTAAPGHAFLGAIMGYYVGRARFAEADEKRRLMWCAFGIPALLHGFYNFPLLAASELEDPESWPALPIFALLLLVPIILCVELIWTRRLVVRARALQLAQGPPLPPAPQAPPTRPELGEPSPRPRSALASWMMILLGGFLASGGGLVTLMVALSAAFEAPQIEDLGELVLRTVVLGVVPAFLGCGLFLYGIQRLNRR